jgi:alanine racemase
MKPAVAEIDLSAIEHNIKQIQIKVDPADVMAVVKANAYGHGAVQVSKTVIDAGVKYLGVARLQEAIDLRKNGVKVPILVFGGIQENEKEYVAHHLDATVFEPSHLNHIAALDKTIAVHIKVDTGMGRLGVPWKGALPFIKQCNSATNIIIKGLYTHFATSDEADKKYAHLQLERFKHVLQQCRDAGMEFPYIHAANSGAILDLPDTYFNLVRPGITIYGYYPSAETSESIPLKPVMTFKTRVIYLKTIGKGTSISYGRVYTSKRKTRIATLAAGYADGYNRLLTNTGKVLINNRVFPVVGRVCMDYIMVDLGLDNGVNIGDEAILFGDHESVNVLSICQKLNTIPYEVTCWVSNRVPRVYKKKVFSYE